jgi:hypothetical protein
VSRNAYEIRLETLCLARDIVNDRYRAQRDAAGDTEGAQEPEVPSVDGVLSEAEKLYAFIAKGKDPSSQLPGA